MTEHLVSKTLGIDQIIAPVRRYWGYDTLRPHQEQAIRAGVEHRDSLVVLPTGGGKSLCYQVPPLLADRTDVVVSPLISLMKDQVDGLRACGYPAAALNSGLTPEERSKAERDIAAGKIKLIFVSPERLLAPFFLEWIAQRNVRAFAIDEAHCISQWGHDFRQEYRQLRVLKEKFPQASVHAYTATATERVREDIVKQLGLKNAHVLVGTFDRPNLVYRVVPRTDVVEQIAEILRRHDQQAAIVYCLSRKDTESIAESLRYVKIDAQPYHAGMAADQRRRVQEAFAEEKLNCVVATIAFGMGIDRSDVRCVIHATMPKSIEHYQQETGRAGRDGLEAECVMLYSAGDVHRWERLIELSAENAPDPRPVIAAGMELLNQMRRLASSFECRHKALSEYFGQAYKNPNCGACDVCLEEAEGLADATVIVQKILSCVARVEQRFGVGHVVEVLRGSNSEAVLKRKHDKLSTWGLLKDAPEKQVQNWVYQLLDQGLLSRSGDEFPVLTLNDASWRVMRGEQTARLIDTGKRKVKKTRGEEVSWEHVDRGLFEHLRGLRKKLADERGVPPFILFSDATLRAMAAMRPSTLEKMLNVPGIGQQKLADLGRMFLNVILSHSRAAGLKLDVEPPAPPSSPSASLPRVPSMTPIKKQAFDMFSRGARVEDVIQATGRAQSTTWGYLVEYVELHAPPRIDQWVDDATVKRVLAATDPSDDGRLKPIFERLGGKVPYEVIRIALAHSRAGKESTNA